MKRLLKRRDTAALGETGGRRRFRRQVDVAEVGQANCSRLYPMGKGQP